VGVAAYYAKGDTKNADVVREMILKQGCTILHDQKGRITYATPQACGRCREASQANRHLKA
jgi:hypothetical protein